jgi:hypothetical protein
MNGCPGAIPCWTVIGESEAYDNSGAVGGPAVPTDGGFVTFSFVCAACCAPNEIGNYTDCAAIPCKSAADCPLDSCGCTEGWCEQARHDERPLAGAGEWWVFGRTRRERA